MAEAQKAELRRIRDALSGQQPLPDVQRSQPRWLRVDNVQMERRYREANLGHQKPNTIIRNSDDALRHSQSIDSNNRRVLVLLDTIRRQIEVLAPRKTKPEDETTKNLQRIIKDIRAGDRKESSFTSMVAPGLIAASNDEINGQVMQWMGRDYLGSTIAGRFTATPPYLSTEKPEFFRRADKVDSKEGTVGFCFFDTNHTTISSEINNEIDRRRIIVHEQLHYASWLGGGTNIRWRQQNGAPVIAGYVGWFHEGLTELHAQQLMLDHGYTTSYTSYPPETTFGFYLQRVVVMGAGDRGMEMLRTAYLTGDFSQVRAIVDQRLGSGTFDIIMGQQDLPRDLASKFGHPRISNGTEALAFLIKRLDSAGLIYSSWNNDPTVRSAGVFGNDR